MYQLISVIISFLLIPILIRKKIKLSYTLLITAGALGILSGIGLNAIGNAILSIVRDSTSLETILTVFMVAILGGLMKHYGILDKIVDTMVLVIRNKKNILMMVPALMGLLVIPGGAMLSAPFVNEIGEDLEISPPKRAAINLIFRHIAMFVLPYSTPVLLVLATVPQIDYPKFILYNLIFVAIVILSGYFIFLKDLKVEKAPPVKNLGSNILKLIVYTSPIYMAVILNGITGWPFYVTLLGSIAIIYLLSNKKNFLKVTFDSISWSTLLTMIAVLIIKDMIINMDGLMNLFSNPTMVVFFIAALFFGYITGNITTSLAIVLPMVSQIGLVENILYLYVYFIYVASFLGYYFSPLHLCQVFTLDIMGVTTGQLYKEYRIHAPTILTMFLISIFLLRVFI